jgi:hypothetical protein
MRGRVDIDDLILNFDPAAPQARFRDGRLGDALVTVEAALPQPIPWPNGEAPVAAPLPNPPSQTDDLSQFHGYDAIVVTWTAAEASALASLFAPGHPIASWYEYRHGVSAYLPLVTGAKAPFNSSSSEMARYRHSLGLYFPCQIGGARVLLFKSGLHLDYDGPAIPVFKLMSELAQTVAPKLFITTGTGGGIGAAVKLGDVVIAGTVRFDCKTQFAGQSWASASFAASKLPPGALEAITPALTRVNAARIPGARGPAILFGRHRCGRHYRFFCVRRLDRSLRPAGARASMRYGRRDGRASDARLPGYPMVFDPQCVRPADSQSHRRNRKSGAAGGADLRPLRWADHRGQPYRDLGDHQRRRAVRAPRQ